MSYSQNIDRIREVYAALEELSKVAVFVGGATVSLYADRATSEVRPTEDVDVLVEIWTRKEYAAVEEKLRSKGFVNDAASGIVCRFKVQDITVDVMPMAEAVLGFSNRWYEEGYQHAIAYTIDERCTVRIFTAPYFIASKLEAFKGRGEGDGRTSQDFEDIVYVLNNRSTVWREMQESPQTVKDYLKKEMKGLLQNPHADEWISANLDFYERSRTEYILQGLHGFVK